MSDVDGFGDGFWGRVRAMLGRGTPPAGDAERAQPDSPSRQLEAALRRGWTEAAGRRVSMCVLAMEMDGFPEYFAAYGQEAVDACLLALEETIGATLVRDGDSCLRAGRTGFVAVLPDMPGLMGRELASRIAAAVRRAGLPHRESHAGHVTLSMGLAVVNPRDSFDRAVLSSALQAVKKAQRRGIGRLEIVDLRIEAEKRRTAA